MLLPEQEKPYPLRVEATLAKKIKHLAKQSKRSYNKEIEFILDSYMLEYEKEHGAIIFEQE